VFRQELPLEAVASSVDDVSNFPSDVKEVTFREIVGYPYRIKFD